MEKAAPAGVRPVSVLVVTREHGPGYPPIVDVLEQEGFQTRCTMDADLARRLSRSGACDAVVLQGRWSEGLDLVRSLRMDPATAGVPVVVVAPSGGPVLDPLEAGADHAISEPVSAADLRARLYNLVGRWRSQRAFLDRLLTAEAALEASAVAMALCEVDGRVTRVNRAFLALWGMSSTREVLDRSFLALWEDPDDARPVVDALRADGSWSGGLRAVRADGARREVRLQATVLRSDDGRPLRFMASIQDVTELVRVHHRLLEAQRIAHIGNWEWDLSTNALWWSDEIYRMFGFAPREMEPDYPWFLSRVHPEDRHLVESAVASALEGRDGYDVEHRIVLPDGRIRTVHESAVRVTDDAGRPARMIGTVQDVTERVSAEHRRRHLEEQLQRAHKMEAMGLLASGIAHDFNNILTVILASATLLQESLPPRGTDADDARQIVEAGERAVLLTRQLLALGRQQVLSPARIDLNDVVRGMSKMLRRLIGEDIAVRLDLGPSAGVVADRTQIEQVLVNLVVNARDAMPTGGTLTISTSQRDVADGEDVVPGGTYVELGVADTGCGMDAETRAHVFEPFYTTKPPGKGTGLGLATVYGIVSQSGGTVRFTSAPGRGATFQILLPRSDARGAAVAVVRKPVPPTVTALRVLVVEDEPQVRAMAQRSLEREGYDVSTASDGQEALEDLLGGGAYDLVVSDVVMPRMSGADFVRRARELGCDVPILFLSGYTEDTTVRYGVASGSWPMLEKPFTPQQLLERVREVLAATRPS